MRLGHLSDTDYRWLCAMLTVVLLAGSLPLMCDMFVVGGPSQPALTINICHRSDAASAPSPLQRARPAVASIQPILDVFQAATHRSGALVSDLTLEPESPPPEATL